MSDLPPVSSFNEWDPLEEVIVGRVTGAMLPTRHVAERVWGQGPVGALIGRLSAGRPYPRYMIDRATEEVEGLAALLRREGITVRRPEILPLSRRHRTPEWSSTGFCTASPRDGILVVGDQLIETASAWRSRYFEVFGYRDILNDYFRRGAQWTAMPRPRLDDASYDLSFRPPADGEPLRYVINENEPLCDAADFTRCGRDLFVIRSNTTNLAGIEWMRRQLGPRFRIHQVQTRQRKPQHIDTTIIPLAPGKVMVNPEFVDLDSLPAVLRKWDVLIPPPPDPVRARGVNAYLHLAGNWISLNVFMLDPERVVVEQNQVSLIRALERWGFTPIPLPFIHYKMYGAGLHCATLDVRRRGTLESYFD
ncbi:amidinotransferase [Myxococcota bacterium]|nr:amidinotransferase [Myxococcota bacterium]